MNNFRRSIGKAPPPREAEPLLLEKGQHETRFDDLTSVSVRRFCHRGGSTRGGDRHRLTSEQVIVYSEDGAEHVADLINVSQGGAMIRADFTPELWQSIGLDFGDAGMLEATVRWFRDDRIGLEFLVETQFGCDPALRDSILLATIRRSFPSYAVRDMDVGQTTTGGKHKSRRNGRESRIARRHPLIWSGEIHYQHDTHQVRLRNISESGAMIECPLPLPIDAGLLLDLGEAGQIFSFVSWFRGGQAGLAFEEDYDMSQLSNARPQVAKSRSQDSVAWEAPDYLRKGPTPTTAWSDALGNDQIERLKEDLEGFLNR